MTYSDSLADGDAEGGCPVCGAQNYPGVLCDECREAERLAEERRRQAARRREFGTGWEEL